MKPQIDQNLMDTEFCVLLRFVKLRSFIIDKWEGGDLSLRTATLQARICDKEINKLNFYLN